MSHWGNRSSRKIREPRVEKAGKSHRGAGEAREVKEDEEIREAISAKLFVNPSLRENDY